MQPADIAITLRRRSPWEAMDLGLTMLRRWWRAVYAAHALIFVPVIALVLAAGWAFDAMWLAMLAIWWLEPLYDRVVLHVLSRAVFGEVSSPNSVIGSIGEWIRGLPAALSFDRFDLARSFNLPVRQLEGQRGREARARRSVLGRRTRSYAVWLTIVWVHFEAVLMWSAGAAAQLVLPVQAERGRGAEDETVFGGLFEALSRASWEDALVYAAVIFVLEPFYVAAGFALYLNRRTLLEGWDIEVALRRLAERHGVAALLVAFVLACAAAPVPAYSQDKNPKKEIAEVLKAKEFGYHKDTERWQPRDRLAAPEPRSDRGWLWAIGYALAKAAEVLLWLVAGALVAYALWWAARMLPRRGAAAPAEPYRPPASLFGMELAPETLPPDISAAAAALAREGRLREALALLYRGALSELVHKRGVELLPSHTEGDVLRLSGKENYLKDLVHAWRQCAYARRMPAATDVERLAHDYKAAFA